LLLLLGALVMILLPAVQQQNLASQPTAEPLPPVVSNAVQATAAASPLEATPLQEPARATGSEAPISQALPAEASPAAPAVVAGLPLPATVAAVSPAVLPATPAASAPASVSTAGTIVFTAKGESWVEVTDAKGVVVLRRTLAAGEAAGASGALPLAAVVGRVDATQVQVRGRPFDLGPVSKDNVARFEVK
jgi:cytoskeleton protein RodZ